MSEKLRVERITDRPLELQKNLTNQQFSNNNRQNLKEEINFLKVLQQQIQNDDEKKSKRNGRR